jgi:hypothetical protein
MLNRFQGEASGMLCRLSFLMVVILSAAKDLLFLDGQNAFLGRAPSSSPRPLQQASFRGTSVPRNLASSAEFFCLKRR